MILVTGGAGFIGSNLVASLRERLGVDVAVCDRFERGDKWRNLAKHEVRELVLPEDLGAWLGADRPIEAVVHLGAISATTETDVDRIIRNNVHLSQELWRFAAERRLPFLYASSAATYGDGSRGFDDDQSPEYLSRLRPLNPYGWSKHQFDRWAIRSVALGETAPAQWAGLKFFNVYGPNEYHKGSMKSVVAHAFPDASAGRAAKLFRSARPDYPDGGQQRDFVYVADCCEVILWLLEHRAVSGLFNVGSGRARTFGDLIGALFGALERPAAIDFVEMPDHLREKYQYWTEGSIDKLRRVGYDRPMHPIEEGVRDYVRNFLATDDPYR